MSLIQTVERGQWARERCIKGPQPSPQTTTRRIKLEIFAVDSNKNFSVTWVTKHTVDFDELCRRMPPFIHHGWVWVPTQEQLFTHGVQWEDLEGEQPANANLFSEQTERQTAQINTKENRGRMQNMKRQKPIWFKQTNWKKRRILVAKQRAKVREPELRSWMSTATQRLRELQYTRHLFTSFTANAAQ